MSAVGKHVVIKPMIVRNYFPRNLVQADDLVARSFSAGSLRAVTITLGLSENSGKLAS